MKLAETGSDFSEIEGGLIFLAAPVQLGGAGGEGGQLVGGEE